MVLKEVSSAHKNKKFHCQILRVLIIFQMAKLFS